jgi:sugar phosphate isomerase/epimerase
MDQQAINDRDAERVHEFFQLLHQACGFRARIRLRVGAYKQRTLCHFPPVIIFKHGSSVPEGIGTSVPRNAHIFSVAPDSAAVYIVRMKRFLLSLLVVASVPAVVVRAGDFQGTAGLQLYSLRDLFKADVPGTLDKVKAFGVTEVETASTYGIAPEKFRAMLTERGLKPVSGHFQYGPLGDNIDAVIAEAKALGLEYVACPWIPHDEAAFTEAVCRKAAADFNKWGEALARAGIRFAYHPHGYEFVPFGDGTLFDLLVKETKPEFVHFEMDVFWVTHPGKSPADLLEKYAGRWELMHLKDLRKGAPTGLYTGHAPLTDDVPLGTGVVDWPKVLRTAAKVGVKHYFIEDESPAAATAIPQSLKYLDSLK